jgi:hypothetical protein
MNAAVWNTNRHKRMLDLLSEAKAPNLSEVLLAVNLKWQKPNLSFNLARHSACAHSCISASSPIAKYNHSTPVGLNLLSDFINSFCG